MCENYFLRKLLLQLTCNFKLKVIVDITSLCLKITSLNKKYSLDTNGLINLVELNVFKPNNDAWLFTLEAKQPLVCTHARISLPNTNA